MEGLDLLAQAVLDQGAVGIALNEVVDSNRFIVGEDQGGLVVAEIDDPHLAQVAG